MKKNLKIISALLPLMTSACSHPSKTEDPLKNTKRLLKEGHSSLYENGAFKVPNTHLYLIPPGPEPLSVVADTLAPQAKASLSKALDAASDSVTVVADGTRATYHFSGKISVTGTKARESIQSMMQPKAKVIVLKSSALGKELIGESWNYGKKVGEKLEQASVAMRELRKDVEQDRLKIRDQVSKTAEELHKQSYQAADETRGDFHKDMRLLSENWILGRIMMDQAIVQNNSDYESKKSLEQFSQTYQESEKDRKETSDSLYYFMNGSFSEAKGQANESFSNAKLEMTEGSKESGYTLAAIRAMGWWLKGVVWDSALVPASKSTVSGMGYVLYNFAAYPVIITSKQGYNTALLAVEYSKLKLENAFEYVAPTGSAALAGIVASAKYVGGYSKAGALKISEVSVETSGIVFAETLAATEKVGLYVGEKSTHYIGIPLAVVGTAAGTALSGAVVAGAGVTTGAIVGTTGEVTAWGADAASKVGAGVVLAGGTAGSLVAGASVGLYQVGQGMVVPPSMLLGSAVVLTYGSLTQLAAQSILLASDAAYLVISLEGPKFVVYSIKGVVHPETDLPQGTVVDLEELRRRGEVIKKLPLSEEEVQKIVNSTSSQLPEKN